jgi:hypothetical protein
MAMEHFRKAVLVLKLVLAMAAVATLAACGAAFQQVAVLDDQKCQADGVQVGSKKYDRCRAELNGERKRAISGAQQQ